MKIIKITLVFLCCLSAVSKAQPPFPIKLIKVLVAPDRPDWTYKMGEAVTFKVQVFRNSVLLPNAAISYEIGPEKMSPTLQKAEVLKNGELSIATSGMKVPGFLRCTVTVTFEGKTYKEWTTAAIAPLDIKPTVTKPADFQAFWDKALAENKTIPFDTKMRLLPERCTEKVDVYEVNLQNWRYSGRLYGILTRPKAPGKYPALLKVPGAGIRPYYGDIDMANDGIITFEIGIHGISVTQPQQVYDDMIVGYQNAYWVNNLNNKETYFYKRVYQGCIRATDYLCSLPDWDGKNLGVMGSSQGGALSLVTAGLDSRITAVSVTHPAMCDMTGDLQGRCGGWPMPFANKADWTRASHADNLETVGYYDALNFAKQVKAPTSWTFGYNDDIVCPTSVYAAYNATNAPKDLYLAVESVHYVFPEQTEYSRNWMKKMLKK
jgi:cephalosporin-C deacetylase